MAKFWAERINYDLERVDTEVPAKLKEKVRTYIEEHKSSTTA